MLYQCSRCRCCVVIASLLPIVSSCTIIVVVAFVVNLSVLFVIDIVHLYYPESSIGVVIVMRTIPMSLSNRFVVVI